MIEIRVSDVAFDCRSRRSELTASYITTTKSGCQFEQNCLSQLTGWLRVLTRSTTQSRWFLKSTRDTRFMLHTCFSWCIAPRL